jgi:hypothetical protein
MKMESACDCDIFHADGTPAEIFCSGVTVEEDEDASMERLAAFTAAYQEAAGNYIHENANPSRQDRNRPCEQGQRGRPD